MVSVDIAALRSIEREKEIPFDTVIDAIEQALLAAYRHTSHPMPNVRIDLDRTTGEVAVIASDISSTGELIEEFDDTPADFGRIAAMTAKQVILQRLRDAEHDLQYGEFAGREGDIVTAVVTQDAQAAARGVVVLDLGTIEAVLPQSEQVHGEVYTHGSVEIIAVAREAGHRSKIAVRSMVAGVNAKGSCIGPMGQRVRNVVAELHGEKIDIIDFDDDPATFVGNALSPANALSITVVDEAARSARVVVPDFQLSLAIGREGQNARLAARLTGWRIDIHSDAEPKPNEESDAEPKLNEHSDAEPKLNEHSDAEPKPIEASDADGDVVPEVDTWPVAATTGAPSGRGNSDAEAGE